jgi:hypothetical protein
MARRPSSTPGVFITSTGWTGKALPYTVDTKNIHRQLAKTQVTHWSPEKIQKMQRAGYFDDLTVRCQVRKVDSLVLHDDQLDELE